MNARLRALLRLLGQPSDDNAVSEVVSRCRLGSLVAEGPMALVFNARSPRSRRYDVVIKFPSPRSPALLQQIQDRCESLEFEAKVLGECSKLSNLVRLRADCSADSLPYIAIEKLGQSLEDLLKTRRSFPTREILVVLRDVATALEGMHAQGHFHNDVKPENILRGPQGWTLIDPCPDEIYSDAFYNEDVASGARRDLLALGETVRGAILGHQPYLLDSEMANRQGLPRIAKLLERMLGYGRPTTAKAGRREVDRVLKDC